MRLRGPKVVETGIFTSPTLGCDSPYELVEDASKPSGFSVRCVESNDVFDTDVLATPTLAQLDEQHDAFARELSAWLVANNDSEVRRESAISEVRELTNLDYSPEDLVGDVEWVRAVDLSARMRVLSAHLPQDRRSALLRLAAQVAASSGISESDAQFIELLGTGVGFHSDVIMAVVVEAMHKPKASAA